MLIIDAPSPNRAPRHQPISAIVLHDTGGKTAASALAWFARTESAGTMPESGSATPLGVPPRS